MFAEQHAALRHTVINHYVYLRLLLLSSFFSFLSLAIRHGRIITDRTREQSEFCGSRRPPPRRKTRAHATRKLHVVTAGVHVITSLLSRLVFEPSGVPAPPPPPPRIFDRTNYDRKNIAIRENKTYVSRRGVLRKHAPRRRGTRAISPIYATIIRTRTGKVGDGWCDGEVRRFFR